MTYLGLDLDNTLISYDKLFYKLAKEKGLIDQSVKENKISVRDFLREKGQDVLFTELQGQVYGPRIIEAEPSDGMLTTLKQLKKWEIKMAIVSHKTRYPIRGEKHDLHKSAIKWLHENQFFNSDGLDFSMDDIIFEESKEQKIKRIKEKNFDYYIDDLPEIVEAISDFTKPILYDPNNKYKSSTQYLKIKTWAETMSIFG